VRHAVLHVLLVTFVVLAPSSGTGLAQTPRPSALFDSAQLLTDLRVLSADDMQGRQVGTPGGEKARAYVVERFRASGIEMIGDSYLRPFTFRAGRGGAAGDRQGVNVVGRVRGTAHPDRFIVVSAHYDHVGVRNGEVYNGADDNASGTAALFALGAHFAANRPANSVLFVAFDAEESGLRGARAFVANPPVPASALALNLNMDMIGRDPDDKLFVAGTHQQPQLAPVVERVAASAPVKLIRGHDDPGQREVENWTRSSDHYAFCQAGIPCLYIGVEDFDQHHEATDDFATMSHDFYVRAVETMVAMVKAFDATMEPRAEPEGSPLRRHIMSTRTVWEGVEAGSNRLIDTLGSLIEAGNVRRVRIRQQQRVIAEFPLTIGVVGVVFAPVLAAIGAITALMTDCAIEVERQVSEPDRPEPPASTTTGDTATPPASPGSDRLRPGYGGPPKRPAKAEGPGSGVPPVG
jgi:hypothetical protein